MSGGFSVPFSSSAPSTPAQKQRGRNSNPFAALSTGPSTTPAGPPPSATNSFTPAGPPPSSVFGSSQLGPGTALFSSKSTKSNKTTQNSQSHPRGSSGTSFFAPSSRTQKIPLNDVDQEDDQSMEEEETSYSAGVDYSAEDPYSEDMEAEQEEPDRNVDGTKNL